MRHWCVKTTGRGQAVLGEKGNRTGKGFRWKVINGR